MATKKQNKIRVKIKGYDSSVVEASAKNIMEVAINTGAKVLGPVPLPTNKNLYAMSRSPFIYKSSFEQFEMKVHKRMIDIIDPTVSTLEKLQNLQLPAGVGIEVK